ncbi:ornithine carbamoyltransferase [Pseudochelatococcus contaminans]|uniref:Ornithine carbamoyltransferase n=1 Tax=Pseudochelatococcus contaminans TaxID=1538103 RepID=A0A7W5Z5V1_9HYPH|nr:ornithine carbamoyltransferase [Pseudochelatococcus contaminans]MBB3810730.1 ornithine carbamoyltransferase [Pseudochelatococcus contaminans]
MTQSSAALTTRVSDAAASVEGVRHFLDLTDFTGAQLREVLEIGKALKARRVRGGAQKYRPLDGKVLAMIFDKPSTRTRVSFDVGIRELGGEPIMLTGAEMQLGRGESIPDTARVLSRFVDAIMIRILDHTAMRELAEYASVPVINGLTKQSHPCQIMADLLTFEEHCGPITGRTVAWTGDANNVLTSWIHAAVKFGFNISIATPAALAPRADIIEWAKAGGANVLLTRDPFEAVHGADAIITDCWVSMGDDDERYRQNLLRPYQVNQKLMSAANKGAVFMHCLPAHRGEEVTDEVMDGPQSVVFDEAENRLHAQKGVLAWCLGVGLADVTATADVTRLATGGTKGAAE